MSKRARQRKTSGTAGFLAAFLLALAMAIGFNWALFGDWNAFPARVRPHIQHTGADDSAAEQISKPLDANVRRRAPGKFF